MSNLKILMTNGDGGYCSDCRKPIGRFEVIAVDHRDEALDTKTWQYYTRCAECSPEVKRQRDAWADYKAATGAEGLTAFAYFQTVNNFPTKI